MQIDIPLFQRVSLRMTTDPTGGDSYPTTALQKGLLLIHGGQELAEEAVGFGVPVLMQGLQTIFPGHVELALLPKGQAQEVTAIFRMDLEEKIGGTGKENVNNQLLYAAKNRLAALIRRYRLLRGPLTATSGGLRQMLGWTTTYQRTESYWVVKMIYTIVMEEGKITVEVDMAGLPRDRITEVVVMNEQGARHFNRYADSSGVSLQDKEIGCWDEVTAQKASFMSCTHQLAFTLEQVAGARLYRGRELIGSRLAWAGFGYSIPPSTDRFSHELRIEKIR